MGLPTALLVAKSRRFDVVGVDLSRDKVALLQAGKLPFVEEGLPELFAEGSAHFRATTELEPADVFLLALPTPLSDDKRCDASAIDAAAESLVAVLRPGNLVILESTVSPGTTRRVHERLRERCGFSVAMSYVSEKAIPGDTLREMVHNDRVVGLLDESARAPTLEVYESFVEGELCLTDATSAETAKLLENTFRDVNIALANEFSELAEEIGVDAYEVIRLANRHPRVNVLTPGPGVGGHCIAIDPWFLV
jgi:nucleotide sugar dehydrogenase